MKVNLSMILIILSSLLFRKLKIRTLWLIFQPINLYNVVYKLLSKVLVNRIKPFLLRLVSETQSAFVSHRLITDNILISSEVFHWLHSGKKPKENGAYAIKIDMSKAYDRVE